MPMPHCAALFWGSSLTVIHNSAWAKARGSLDGQGSSASDAYKAEALSALQTVARGRTVKVGKHRAHVCSFKHGADPIRCRHVPRQPTRRRD
jgi:hypothetical protein